MYIYYIHICIYIYVYIYIYISGGGSVTGESPGDPSKGVSPFATTLKKTPNSGIICI